MVSLRRITQDNYKECLELRVAEDQKLYFSPNLLSLAKAYVLYDSVMPFGIYEDSIMVGL